MSEPAPGTIVFVYPFGVDDPDKAYPGIVTQTHPAERAKGDNPGHPPTLDLVIIGWHTSPVIEAHDMPFLAKWDDHAPRPFALAQPHKKTEAHAKAA